ncbi:MAG TPA: Uma2 family endonuclease [Pirellulales bacterium]|nr:Uma2 family endonuclease [Pirellulales bacterium]
MSISTRPLPGTAIDPLYPDTDGEPMGEGAFHLIAFLHLCGALFRFFAKRQDVYVAGDMFLYYDEGNPDAKKAPDVMVAKGVRGNHPRRSFRTWEEGVVPAVVFEIVSRRTQHEDRNAKKDDYAQIGITEYFIFDPEGISAEPLLQGFRLHEGRYVPLAMDEAGRVTSRELGLNLEVDEPYLRVIDPRSGERLKTDRELEEENIETRAKAEKEKQRADAERRRADNLEAELARLRASQPRPDSN